jgi:amino acid adenylation domain-containing protein
MSEEASGGGPDVRDQRRALLTEKLGARDAEVFPLSFTQQRLWFLDQLEPGKPVYYVPLAFRLEGTLDVEALQSSLREIVRRHEILRTTFRSIGGQPVQVVAADAVFELASIDLGGVPASEREETCRRRLREESVRPFDLERGPLIRVCLFRLGPEDHVLSFAIHHIVTDGWSVVVLLRELNALYAGFLKGETVVLPELPVQYGDWAVWQRQWVEEEILERQLGYWKKTLADLQTLELPADHPRPAVQSSRGATWWWALPKDLGDELRSLASQENATFFMALAAAFTTLLGRYAGQTDVSLGTPVSNRSESETQNLIGLFVNMLILRVDLNGNPTFREHLRRVRDASLEAYAHQDLPIERLVSEIQPSRDQSRTQLFQVALALEDDLAKNISLPGLTARDLPVDTGTAKFDLTLFVWDRPGGLEASFEYNTDLFESETISRMAGHFTTLLEGVVSNPERRLSDLPLLTPEEERLLLVEWNSSEKEIPRNRTVVEFFEEQVARRPGAVAAELGDQSLTYEKLNLRADQLGAHLRRRGVGPEVLVAILLERSLDMPVAVLGVLKAGGAYLPLDPSYPPERLAFMFEDSRAPFVLTQKSLIGIVPTAGIEVICLDRDWPAIVGGAGDGEVAATRLVQAPAIHPSDLAYVIYTSGSTGRPKGTELTQQGLLNLVFTHPDFFRVHGQSRMLQFATLSFDASVWELFLPLTRGGRMVLAPRDELQDPQTLAALLDRTGITITLLPPSMLAQLPTDAGRSMELLCVGGEACPPGLAGAWAGRGCLMNVYGPTETTVIITGWPVPPDFPGERAPAIGWALPNVKTYVLDANLRPAPIGVPGELCVGGPGVARGYLRRPQLTAERFVPDPYGAEPGCRLYRTGDLVRLLPDGAIDFLGRIDQQVKIRGFRVELGEIEAVLSTHPEVREVAVTVWEPSPGDKRIAAYLTTKADGAVSAGPSVENLRGFLGTRFPEHMIPSVFVTLDRLPLSPTGKLDRKALPNPAASAIGSEVAYVAPRTAREETVAGVWRRILGRERIGIHDNFFDLGGHSLLATQVVSAVRQAFRVSLPLRTLFERPTVSGLTEAVEEALLSKLDPAQLEKLLGQLEGEGHD